MFRRIFKGIGWALTALISAIGVATLWATLTSIASLLLLGSAQFLGLLATSLGIFLFVACSIIAVTAGVCYFMQSTGIKKELEKFGHFVDKKIYQFRNKKNMPLDQVATLLLKANHRMESVDKLFAGSTELLRCINKAQASTMANYSLQKYIQCLLAIFYADIISGLHTNQSNIDVLLAEAENCLTQAKMSMPSIHLLKYIEDKRRHTDLEQKLLSLSTSLLKRQNTRDSILKEIANEYDLNKQWQENTSNMNTANKLPPLSIEYVPMELRVIAKNYDSFVKRYLFEGGKEQVKNSITENDIINIEGCEMKFHPGVKKTLSQKIFYLGLKIKAAFFNRPQHTPEQTQALRSSLVISPQSSLKGQGSLGSSTATYVSDSYDSPVFLGYEEKEKGVFIPGSSPPIFSALHLRKNEKQSMVTSKATSVTSSPSSYFSPLVEDDPSTNSKNFGQDISPDSEAAGQYLGTPRTSADNNSKPTSGANMGNVSFILIPQQ
jgi:hypothetical protein